MRTIYRLREWWAEEGSWAWWRLRGWIRRRLPGYKPLPPPSLEQLRRTEELRKALEAGYSSKGCAGSELKVESLEATLRNVVFWRYPVREVGDERRPWLEIQGKFYEFRHDGRRWVQTLYDGEERYFIRTARASAEKLGWWRLRQARRLLKSFR